MKYTNFKRITLSFYYVCLSVRDVAGDGLVVVRLEGIPQRESSLNSSNILILAYLLAPFLSYVEREGRGGGVIIGQEASLEKGDM